MVCMSFTAKDVKDLREKTGCGMMDCKKALSATDGDMEKAIDFLREKGLSAAAKKSGRATAEGLAIACTDQTKRIAAAIEVNVETDFVSKNEGFKAFVKQCADTVIEKNPSSLDELLGCQASGSSQTIGDLLQEKILTIGENIKIRRFARCDGVVSTYIHADGKIGVMVKFLVSDESKLNESFDVFGKDIAMQIAAANPTYLNRESVPQEVADKERRILKEQIVNDGKPENIAEKIVEGRMDKFYKEVCLMDQIFVKDNDYNIREYVQKVSSDMGMDIDIESFVRYERGEGLEKREDDFAKEVANMVR